ncbi:sensor histidine kinase [Enterococcus dongliensis]|uniref:sensor histidine kinase n=1 Tax=Enterococcus dongliensis TaxID=2559925 RepID=UPI002891F8F9|nr:histidine kinase [Enterococcus dongliensis]MDT2612755.1 histidine kinase [Enterococcus dongliensis]
MQRFNLFFSVLTVGSVLTLLFVQQSPVLTTAIIVLLLWLSLLLLSASFKKYRFIFLLLQLGIVLIVSFFQPWSFYLLPGTIMNFLILKKNQRLILFAGSALLLFYGIHLPNSAMQISGFLWTIFVFYVSVTIAELSQEKRGLNDSSDMLRVERNRLASLFEQSIMNSEAREKEAILSERQRLVHEIHDELGHKLSGGLIQMEAARAVYQKDEKQAEKLLNQAIVTTREGIDDIRKILHAEAPEQETLNLNRLKTELQRFTERYQLKTSFHYFGKVDQLSSFQWQVLLGNLKESLTNTLKYAEATEVAVRLHVFKGFLRFEISNNGKTTKSYKKGLGILGMEERTAMLSGQLVIDTTNGFTVTTILPIVIR